MSAAGRPRPDSGPASPPHLTQVALVTGAASGIGRYLAEHLAAAGYAVVGCSRRELDPLPTGFRYHPVDVTDEAAVQRLLRDIRRRHGRLDALVNCAGQASMNLALLTPTATVERLLATNVTGTFIACREAARLMARRGFGRIVNFSSAAVPLQTPGEAAYVASKCAVTGLSQVLAHELAAAGITVNVVGPGPTDTAMLAGVPAQQVDRMLRRTATGRRTRLADIANAVDFFLRPQSGAVTGQVLYLGGSRA